jgi:23S rRNA (pseudouridine1915-N3)-methyltransferase
MRVIVVAVGRVKERPVRAAIDEYAQRIRRYTAFDEIELADAPAAKLEPAFGKATAEATTLALEVTGKVLDSEGFARGIARASERNKGIVAFLIGGADGLPARVSSASHDRWSLSALTFPHRIARLVLVEQIYRSMTILRGEPYGH